MVPIQKRHVPLKLDEVTSLLSVADVGTGRQLLDIPQGRACNGGLQTIHIQPTTHQTRRCV
jgi:hypothetical protein